MKTTSLNCQNFPVFWPVSFFGPWDQVQWMWWCWTQPVVLASVEVKLADVCGLVDGGCVPRFFLQVSCSFFEREGQASPPRFFLRFERKHWMSRSDQVSNTFTHPIFVLRCPLVKGANDLTKAKLVADHLANRHLTFVTALLALTNAHVEDKMSRWWLEARRSFLGDTKIPKTIIKTFQKYPQQKC